MNAKGQSEGDQEEERIRIQAKVIEDAKKAATETKEAFEALREKGFCAHFADYNVQLFRPFKYAWPPLSTVLCNLLQCSMPIGHARSGFILMNVLTFWVGVAEAVWCGMLGNTICLVWRLLLSYVAAYTLFWMILIVREKCYQRIGLALNVAYIVFNAFSALTGLLFLLPALAAGFKAVLNANMLLYAIKVVGQDNPELGREIEKNKKALF